MNPAYSTILFSTLSGAGYGLLAALGLFGASGGVPADRGLGIAGIVIALAMITAGLLASASRLGHRERAWRALSQWRTSWLSRLAIFAVGTYPPTLMLLWGWTVEGRIDGPVRLVAVITIVLSLYTVYCSGMVYATLRPVRAWFNPYTVLVALSFAVWTGSLWFNLLAHIFGLHTPVIGLFVMLMAFVTWFLKRKYWVFLDSHPVWVPPENALGLDDAGAARLIAPPATQDTYVQREMGYRVARDHARKLRVIAFIAFAVVPLAAMLPTQGGAPWLAVTGALVALASGMTGTLIERWLFFAEAKHTAMLYFGAGDS